MSKSRHIFVCDLLEALHAPGSLNNAIALVAQIQAEGGQAHFNPLNTTLRQAGSTDYNSVHVQNYKSWTQGIAATAKTLEQANMAKLLKVLKAGGPAAAYWTALGVSPWGTHPPGGMKIELFLDDVSRHWFDRALMPIAGS